jgi:hypothetical protein
MALQTAVFPSDLHKPTPLYIAERENRFICITPIYPMCTRTSFTEGKADHSPPITTNFKS